MPQCNHLPVEEHLDSFKLLVFKGAMHIPMRIISHFSGKKNNQQSNFWIIW